MKIEDIYPTNEEDIKKRFNFDNASDSEKQKILDIEHEKAILQNQKNFKELANQTEDQEKKGLYEKVFSISRKVEEKGGIALIVGGFVRDTVMSSIGYDPDPKDIDIEVYGLEISVLEEVLNEFGEVNLVGASFGVLKLGDLDISIPRSDSKTASGHKGFDIKGNPNMLLREAAKRRDLTINSLALNPITGEVIDPFDGIADILNRKIRATDANTFGEDPLRVLRVMQFAGRFNFNVEERTKEICIKLVRDGSLDELPIERFEEEWKKLLLKSDKPSKGLEVARELEIVSHYPELEALIGCPQEKDWHPEGDVWTHTLMVLDEAKKIAKRENLDKKQSLVLLFAALCHDFGKPLTTTVQKIKDLEKITAYGHEEAGLEPARKFLKSINISEDLIKEILPLVAYHLFPSTYSEKITDSAIRRMIKKIYPASIKSLVFIGEADAHGRGYWDDQPNTTPEAKKWEGYKNGELLLGHASKLSDVSLDGSKVLRYINGKKLIELGLDPKLGKEFGEIIGELDKAQEEGKILGPEDLRLAKLFVFLKNTERSVSLKETLLSGEDISTIDMISEIKDRFFEIGTHDMGTLVMTLLLKGEILPPVLERNKKAILTAHKHGPAWFKKFDREFYDTSWKSFYGQFEVDAEKQKELSGLDFEKQLKIGLDLILNPDNESVRKYKESFDIKPKKYSDKVAFYSTNLYPFETGMMNGFEIMIQFVPEKKRLCISVMNEDPEVVKQIDKKIRENFLEFRNAKKVGYLFASNKQGDDNVFSEEDGERVYEKILEIIK